MANKLRKYTWGLGLEHEMHLFHFKKDRKTNIKSFTLYDSETARRRLLNDYNLKNSVKITNEDWEFISEIPFEKTGRLCNGKWVIKKVPYDMPEFITNHPITKIGKDRNITDMCNQLIYNKEKFIKLIKKDPTTTKQIKKYGDLMQYPFGMTSYLKYPENSHSLRYDFRKNKDGTNKVREEYVGSYHITLTLPYIQNVTQHHEFVEQHKNFANQLQWLEPLLLTAFFSGDEKAPGSAHDRVRGSFRVMIIGWGNFAGSDVRKLRSGIGRYSDIDAHWRKGLKLYQSEKLKPCYQPSPYAKREGGISTLSSNFRTFGDDQHGERVSGAGMTVGNGVEFRIFDQFNDNLLPDLVRFISLVAENSRVHHTDRYVYKNKHWIGALHEIMRVGWHAQLKTGYINELRRALNLKINTKSKVAHDILTSINDELYKKHKNGDFYVIMNHGHLEKPNIPHINLESWIMGCCMRLNRNPTLLKKFNKLIESLPDSFTRKKFETEFFKHFSEKNWGKDVINFIYFLNKLRLINITENVNGTIKCAKVISRKEFKNMNSIIEGFFREI